MLAFLYIPLFYVQTEATNGPQRARVIFNGVDVSLKPLLVFLFFFGILCMTQRLGHIQDSKMRVLTYNPGDTYITKAYDESNYSYL